MWSFSIRSGLHGMRRGICSMWQTPIIIRWVSAEDTVLAFDPGATYQCHSSAESNCSPRSLVVSALRKCLANSCGCDMNVWIVTHQSCSVRKSRHKETCQGSVSTTAALHFVATVKLTKGSLRGRLICLTPRLRPSQREVRAGSEGRPACWFAHRPRLIWLSYVTQDHLTRDWHYP